MQDGKEKIMERIEDGWNVGRRVKRQQKTKNAIAINQDLAQTLIQHARVNCSCDKVERSTLQISTLSINLIYLQIKVFETYKMLIIVLQYTIETWKSQKTEAEKFAKHKIFIHSQNFWQ